MGVCCSGRREFIVTGNNMQVQEIKGDKSCEQQTNIKSQFSFQANEKANQTEISNIQGVNQEYNDLASGLILKKMCTINGTPLKRKVCISESTLQMNEDSTTKYDTKHETSYSKLKSFSRVATNVFKNAALDVKSISERCNQSLQKSYTIVRKIGKGTYGLVYKVVHKITGQIRALKVIKKDNIWIRDDGEDFLKEIEILKKVDHINIAKIYEYFEDELNYFIVSEYVPEGALFDSIQKVTNIDEHFVRKIMKQLLSAVTYLHKMHITHHDLKPDNILISKIMENGLEIKIVDYGIPCFIKKSKKVMVDFPSYVSPDVLYGNQNEKCDIWSCGVLLHVLLIGYPPFRANTVKDLFEIIKKGVLTTSSNEWCLISEQAKDLIIKMLNREHLARYSADQCLDHEWMSLNIRRNSKLFFCRFHNLTGINSQEQFRQSTIAFISFYKTLPSPYDELEKTLKMLDTEEVGALSLDNIKAGFELIFGSALNEIEINIILRKQEFGVGNAVPYLEFVNLIRSEYDLRLESNVRLSFESLRSCDNTKLAVEEILKAFNVLEDLNLTKLIALIKEKCNLFIDFAEFRELMNEVICSA